MELNMLFADRLKSARLKKGFTQGHLAERSGVHEKAIAKYERGVALPSVDTLVKLAMALEVCSDYLLFPHAQMKGIPTVKNPALYEKYFIVETLSDKDQEAVLTILDSLIARQRFRELNREFVS